MEPLELIALLLRLTLLLAGLFVPGAAILRALRLPFTLNGAFVASAVTLYASALALHFVRVPLSLLSLTAALVVVAASALFLSRRAAAAAPAPESAEPTALAPFLRLGVLAPVFVLFWAVVGFLLAREPLAGPDTGFRWAFLPEQWLRLGSLDFYPPLSARDFTSYFWVESIPPGVASLHAWAFACGGSFAPEWAIPVTALQLLALHDLAWRLGHAVGGHPAARAAAALLAACPLLVWSSRLAQETGLTAVAALGLACALLRWRDTARPAWAAATGLCAALGATTREYGLVFPALAAAAFVVAKAPRRAWLAFAATALPVALVWPLRCLLRTGNPFYSLDLGGLAPVNPVFAIWVADHRGLFGFTLVDGSLWHAARWIALTAAPAAFGWFAVLYSTWYRRRAVGVACAIAVFLGLWLWSVPYTVGGLFYSLRVTSPALALGAVAAGIALARVRPVFLGAFLLATLPFTLLLPLSPLKVPLAEWPAPWHPAPSLPAAHPERIVPAIASRRPSAIVTDSAGFQDLLAPLKIEALPLWSPQVSWLFDPQLAPADAARRWRESGLRLVVMSKFAPAIDFVNRRARWHSPAFRFEIVAESPGFIVLDVQATPSTPPGPQVPPPET